MLLLLDPVYITRSVISLVLHTHVPVHVFLILRDSRESHSSCYQNSTFTFPSKSFSSLLLSWYMDLETQESNLETAET